MAMTKAEKAAMEELETRAALCWPPFERPKPMTREEIAAAETVTFTQRDTLVIRSRTVVVAWFCNPYSREVTKGWVEGHLCNHNDPDLKGYVPSRFERMVAFRSEEEAWRELCWAVAEKAAKELRSVRLLMAAKGVK